MTNKIRLYSLLFGIASFAAASHAEEIIVNGDFSNGNAAWLGDLGNVGVWDVSPMAGGGNRFAKLGGTNDNSQRVWNNAYFGFVPGTGTFTFDISTDRADVPGFDFLQVKIGSHIIDLIDLGGVSPGWSPVTQKSYDISAYVGHLSNSVEFKVLTDFSAPSTVVIDNVSIQTQPVPEPATLAIIGGGLLGVMRRRKKRC